MNVEDRLRSALRDEAEGVTPTDERWAAIEERASGARRRRAVRNTGLSVLSIAAVLALVVGLVSVLDDDETVQRVTVGNQPAATTPSTATTAVPEDEPPTAVWDRTFDDPESAAKAFATEYLGMKSPTVVASDADAQYLIRAKAGRGPFTRVVTKFQNGAWWVTGAASDNLQLTTPAAGARVGSPVDLRGRSRSFEAHVNVEVRQIGGADAGRPLATTFFTGGGGGEALEPFNASVRFRMPETSIGAVLLLVYSAEDGSLAEATVVPVRFG